MSLVSNAFSSPASANSTNNSGTQLLPSKTSSNLLTPPNSEKIFKGSDFIYNTPPTPFSQQSFDTTASGSSSSRRSSSKHHRNTTTPLSNSVSRLSPSHHGSTPTHQISSLLYDQTPTSTSSRPQVFNISSPAALPPVPNPIREILMGSLKSGASLLDDTPASAEEFVKCYIETCNSFDLRKVHLDDFLNSQTLNKDTIRNILLAYAKQTKQSTLTPSIALQSKQKEALNKEASVGSDETSVNKENDISPKATSSCCSEFSSPEKVLMVAALIAAIVVGGIFLRP